MFFPHKLNLFLMNHAPTAIINIYSSICRDVAFSV